MRKKLSRFSYIFQTIVAIGLGLGYGRIEVAVALILLNTIVIEINQEK